MQKKTVAGCGVFVRKIQVLNLSDKDYSNESFKLELYIIYIYI